MNRGIFKDLVTRVRQVFTTITDVTEVSWYRPSYTVKVSSDSESRNKIVNSGGILVRAYARLREKARSIELLKLEQRKKIYNNKDKEIPKPGTVYFSNFFSTLQ